jgi:type I restriction enzyme S subunit
MGFDMVRLDQLATFEMGQSPESKFVIESNDGIPFLQGCAEFGAITPNFVVSCTRPKKTCQPGDILISVRAPVGDLNKADREYCIGRGLAAVRFNDGIASNFGWHLLKFWSSSLRIVAQGSTFEAIGRRELANLQVTYVSLPEQRRIAEILDTIDEAIQKTEALISKLKAMKQGLLHDLLTRGLDKNGKLRDPKAHPEQFKDSTLGRTPKEWQVVSIGKISRVRRGASPSGR